MSAAETTRSGSASERRRQMPVRLWGHQETADFLGIPAQTLHQHNSKGTGPRSYKIGRWRRYDPADIAAWLEARASDRGAAD